jgi:CheY-like chemotaxis protein
MLRKSDCILVVDDDPDVRDAIVELLEEVGYAVDAASDGLTALARLRAPAPPSLVLLDLMMPVMDGFEFRVQQLQDPRIAAIPVIVFSSGGDLGEKVARLRVDGCLTKPVDPEALLHCLATRFDPPAGAPQNA